MAKYTGAFQKPLGKETQPKMSSHDIVCLHTMVGYLFTTDRMFMVDAYKGLESHFGVGGEWGSDATHALDGVVYQWQDTEFTADANLDGNHHVISIETGDNAPAKAKDIKPWTSAQLKSIIKLVAWVCKTHDIPPVLIPDTKPGRRGIAYHRQGVMPVGGAGALPGYLVKGGEKWSSSVGKECPGDARVEQLINLVIPAVKILLNPPTPQDVDMAVQASDALAIAKAVWGSDIIPDDADPKNPTWRADSELRHIKATVDTIQANQAEILALLKGTQK